MVKFPFHCRYCTFFKIDIGSFNELYHFIFVSYLLNKHMYMLTNFSAII